MKALDTPIEAFAGRTAREALLVCGFAAICGFELLRQHTNFWHLGVYLTFTGLFAVRFFAARVVAIGVLLSALAAHVANARYGTGWEPTAGVHWIVYVFAGGVVLLMSRDLAERFDYAESGPGWRLNRWRNLPRSHWRAATVLGWSLGTLGHFLLRAWQMSGEAGSTWALIAIVSCIVLVFVLFTGRSIVFLLSAALGIFVLSAAYPHVVESEAFIRNALTNPRPGHAMWGAAPGEALPVAIAAGATALVALPYALLHLWRSLIAPR